MQRRIVVQEIKRKNLKICEGVHVIIEFWRLCVRGKEKYKEGIWGWIR